MKRLVIAAVGLALVVGSFTSACANGGGGEVDCGVNLRPEVDAACDAFESYLVAVDEGRFPDAEALLSPYCDTYESFSVLSGLASFVATSGKHVQDVVTFYGHYDLVGPTRADAELVVRFAYLKNAVTFQYMTQYDGQWKVNCYPKEESVPQAFEWLQHVLLLP